MQTKNKGSKMAQKTELIFTYYLLEGLKLNFSNSDFVCEMESWLTKSSGIWR